MGQLTTRKIFIGDHCATFPRDVDVDDTEATSTTFDFITLLNIALSQIPTTLVEHVNTITTPNTVTIDSSDSSDNMSVDSDSDDDLSVSTIDLSSDTDSDSDIVFYIEDDEDLVPLLSLIAEIIDI